MDLKKQVETVAQFYSLSENQKFSLERCLAIKENLLYILNGYFKEALSRYNDFYFGREIKKEKDFFEIYKELYKEISEFNLIMNALNIAN